MKIIFAQGNPEPQYTGSRHNIGFLILDEFAAKHGVGFISKPKFIADIAELTVAGEKVLLVKPSTFYNETGRSARAICDFYKCDPATDLLAIHDDFALPLGTIRVRAHGSSAGNNGIKSLNAHLGENYWRLRIGIYVELRSQIDDVDFVLGKFNADERKQLPHITDTACELINQFIADTLQTTSVRK